MRDVARPRGFDTEVYVVLGWLMSTYRVLLTLLFIGIASTALGQTKIPTRETNVRLLDAKTPQTKEPHRLASVDGQRYCAVDRGTSVHRT